eukprot:scaffold25231_cov34-Prasinocladus_malaysianus.AAC.3
MMLPGNVRAHKAEDLQRVVAETFRTAYTVTSDQNSITQHVRDGHSRLSANFHNFTGSSEGDETSRQNARPQDENKYLPGMLVAMIEADIHEFRRVFISRLNGSPQDSAAVDTCWAVARIKPSVFANDDLLYALAKHRPRLFDNEIKDMAFSGASDRAFGSLWSCYGRVLARMHEDLLQMPHAAVNEEPEELAFMMVMRPPLLIKLNLHRPLLALASNYHLCLDLAMMQATTAWRTGRPLSR